MSLYQGRLNKVRIHPNIVEGPSENGARYATGGGERNLFSSEMRRVQGGGRPPGREQRLLDVYNERPVRLSAKVSITVREHPKVAADRLLIFHPSIPVQLCWEAARPPRQLAEAAAGGDDDEDGGARPRLDEEQAAGGGAEELDGPEAQPPQGGAPCGDHCLCFPSRGSRQAGVCLDRGRAYIVSRVKQLTHIWFQLR